MTAPTPVRIQRKRTRGFDLQAVSRAVNGLECVVVDRSSGFGSPFPITKAWETTRDRGRIPLWAVGTWGGPALWFEEDRAKAVEISVKAFATWLQSESQRALRERAILHLRGKNLACFCRMDHACHADVLLEIANRPICEAVE